jgi:hypothetical protein
VKRLKVSGSLQVDASHPAGSADKVIKKAILVHAGPNGTSLTFSSSDGEIAFDEARIRRIIDNQNKLIMSLAEQYGGFEKIPPGAFPPVLDQHSDDSNDRIIGRMQALLKFEVLDVPKVGKGIPCAVTDLTFLGEDTVKRVADGRIHHLSIGISEETDTLGEVSAVIDPAAPGAMLLAAGRKKTTKVGATKMPVASKLVRMQRSAKRLATLSGIKDDLTKLQSELKGSAQLVRMTKKEGEVTHRLSALMKSGRLTPAEYKKLDVKRLAKLPDEALDTVINSMEVREPVIEPGQRGSKDAVDFATLGKGIEKKKMKNLAKETMRDLVKMSGGKVKLKAGSHLEAEHEEDDDHGKGHEMSGPKEKHESPGKDEHAVEGEEEQELKRASFKSCMAECSKHLADGDVEKAKEAHGKALAHLEKEGDKHLSFGVGDTKSEDYKKGMDAMEAKVDELSTNLARLAGAVTDLMGGEEEEGKELEKEPDDKDLEKEVEEDTH